MPVFLDASEYVSISDDFNRANNEATLGANWINYHQGGTMGINSNRAAPTGSADGIKMAIHRRGMRTHNHWVEGTIPTVTNGRPAGLVLRADATNAQNYIRLAMQGTTTAVLQRVNAVSGHGSPTVTNLANVGNTATWTAGSRARIEYEFDECRIYRNGTLIATYTGIPYGLNTECTCVGLFTSRSWFANSGTIDDWAAGDLLPN